MALNQTIHKSMLLRILKEIYSHHEIGPQLGFKGGTAAYLFYGLERFSVDLDFDLLSSDKVDLVFAEVKNILEKFGKVKTADNKRYSLLFILAYNDKEIDAQNIKLEINKRQFGSKYEIKTYLGISLKVMVREDMIANKLVALYERIGKTNRDVYDSWFFLSKGWAINSEIIEQRTAMTFRDFLVSTLQVVRELNDRQMLSGMGELLNDSQKVWVRNRLKYELIFQLELLLSLQP
jgi:predicted nucleotidyltransferase component of viral defense system